MNQTGSRHNSSLTYIFLIFNKNINAARQRTRNELVVEKRKKKNHNRAKVYLKLNLYSNITTTVINLPVVYFYPILSFTSAGWQFAFFNHTYIDNEIMHYSLLLCKAKKEDIFFQIFFLPWGNDIHTMISFLHRYVRNTWETYLLDQQTMEGLRIVLCASSITMGWNIFWRSNANSVQ